MKYGYHNDVVLFCKVENAIRKSLDIGAAQSLMHKDAVIGLPGDFLDRLSRGAQECPSKSGALLLVPDCGFLHIFLGRRPNDDAAGHNFFSSRALTTCQLSPCWGFAS